MTVTRADHIDARREPATDPLDAIALFAIDVRATRIAAEAKKLRVERVAGVPWTSSTSRERLLCRRLAHHIGELQRSLGRSYEDCANTINAMSILRVLIETVIQERAQQPDSDRNDLERWLATERVKFLMGSKVDAAIALEERLIHISQPLHELRRATAALTEQVIAHYVGRFSTRVRAEAEKKLALVSLQLLTDLELSFGDLGETIPLDVLAGVAPIGGRGRACDLIGRPSSRIITSMADRMGLSSRRKVELAARDAVFDGLEHGSRRVMFAILHDYDDAREAVEQDFCGVVDSWLETARYAAVFAAEARVGGADAVTRARSRVAHWYESLGEIAERFG